MLQSRCRNVLVKSSYYLKSKYAIFPLNVYVVTTKLSKIPYGFFRNCYQIKTSFSPPVINGKTVLAEGPSRTRAATRSAGAQTDCTVRRGADEPPIRRGAEKQTDRSGRTGSRGTTSLQQTHATADLLHGKRSSQPTCSPANGPLDRPAPRPPFSPANV